MNKIEKMNELIQDVKDAEKASMQADKHLNQSRSDLRQMIVNVLTIEDLVEYLIIVRPEESK